MADFWGGFGQGFAPSFEKALDRRRAEKKRLAEIERLAEVAKQERLGRLIGYEGALGEEEFRGLLPESGRTPINPEVYPKSEELLPWKEAADREGVGGVFPKPLPRQYRSLEDVMGGMGKKDRIGLEMAAKLMLEKKLRDEGRAYESEKATLASQAAFNKLLSTGAAGQAGEEGKKASVEGKALADNPYANTPTFVGQMSQMSWAAAWNKSEAEKGTTKEARTYELGEHTRRALAAGSADRYYQMGRRSIYLPTDEQIKLPEKGTLNYERFKEGVEYQKRLGPEKKELNIAEFDATEDNVTSAFLPDITTLYKQTHFGKELPGTLRLVNWSAGQKMLNDLIELDFLQKQYERIMVDPKLGPVAQADGYKELKSSMTEISNEMDIGFFTNPKDLELAIRRIYGIFDAEAEKRRRGDDVPYEYYSVYDPDGGFKFRTWRLKAEAPDGSMRPSQTFIDSKGKTVETDADRWIKRANDGLSYEAMTFGGKDMIPVRRINAVDVEKWNRRAKAGQRPPTTVERGGGPLPTPTPPPVEPEAKEAVPPDAKPLPPGAKVTPEGVIIGNVTYPIGEPLGNEDGPKYEIIIINGKPYQRPVK